MSTTSKTNLIINIVILGLAAYVVYVFFIKSDSDIYGNYVKNIEADLISKDCVGAGVRLSSLQSYVASKRQYHQQFLLYAKSVRDRVEQMKRAGQCS